MRTTTPATPSGPSNADDPLRCCDLAKIGLVLAVAAGFVCQAAVWLAM